MLKVKIFEQMARVGIRRQKELSDKSGISESNISHLVSGKAKGIQFHTLQTLCGVLECQPGDLLEYVPDAEAAPKKSRKSA